MAGLEVQVGTPPVDGRYVVWSPCKALQVREWCEPSIATWHGGRWHTYEPVRGWVGPLPVVHGNDCLKKMEIPPMPDGFIDPYAPDAAERLEEAKNRKYDKQEYDL